MANIIITTKRNSLRQSTIPKIFWILAVSLLTVLANIVSAEALGSLVAINDGKTSNLEVYYLSPRVLTRTRMTPDRLKQDTFRIENRNLPVPRIVNLSREIRSTEHQNTERNVWGYDFRLCISSDGNSTWFSSDAKVGYTHSAPFLLSEHESLGLLSLFDELDLRLAHIPKRKR